MDYQEYADRHNKAYEAFRSTYEKKNAPPVKPEVRSEHYWLKGFLVLLMVASMIVSGSRTIPEFGESLPNDVTGLIVGVAAFFMLELGIIVYPFVRTALYYDDEKHKGIKRLLGMGKWLALVVVVAANLHHMLTTNGYHIPTANEVMITTLSIGAPILAFIAGDTLGMLMVRDNHRRRKAEEEYKAEYETYIGELNARWNREQKSWGVHITNERPETSNVQSSNGQSNGQQSLPTSSTLGHTKAPDASKTVKDYLEQNPEAMSLPARELASLLGVGKSTVANVQKELRDVQHQTNGHGKE